MKLGLRTSNDLAFDMQKKMRARMAKVFDRPTPAVIRAVQVDKAVGNGPSFVSTVSLKSTDSDFQQRLNVLAQTEEFGGTLTPGEVGRKVLSVPGYNSPLLNRYGSINRGAIAAIMSAGTYRKSQVGIFTVNGHEGLWQRVGKDGHELRLLALFEQSAVYKPRLGFYDTARAVMADAASFATARVARINGSKGNDAGPDASPANV